MSLIESNLAWLIPNNVNILMYEESFTSIAAIIGRMDVKLLQVTSPF